MSSRWNFANSSGVPGVSNRPCCISLSFMSVASALLTSAFNRFVTSAIGGPRTEEQWEDYVAALACRLDAADEALVDRLVSPGHPSTPGYNDPSYPIEGRVGRG